jgi:hypothetical protein
VFSAGDGRLYTHDFTEEAGGRGVSTSRVDWACPVPGDSPPVVGDPVAPVVPALGGRLLVSLSRRVWEGDKLELSAAEIWWLKLDPEGRAVRTAGRLTAAGGPPGEERLPNLGVAPDGRLVAAYLRRSPGHLDWRLSLVPVEIDPESGDPVASGLEVCDVGGGISVNTPGFSPDGRWVYAVPRDQSPGPVALKVSVLDALAAAAAERSVRLASACGPAR